MDALFDFSIEASRWLQSNYPQLEGLFALASDLGRFEFYLAAITIIYWCVDKNLGMALAYVLSLSDMLNGLVKHSFRDPRPLWVDETIGLSAEESYGIPSGHAQGATVFYLLLGGWLRKRWIWFLALIAVFIMGLSRVYLGVHDIPDVLAGGLLGAVILVGVYFWRRHVVGEFSRRILGQRLLAAVSVPLALAAIYVVIRVIIGEPDLNVAWSDHVPAAETTSVVNMATAFGGLLGLTIGFIFEGSRVRFLVSGQLWKRVVRYAFSIAGALLIWRGLGILFPDDPLWLAIPLRVVRYFLLGIWVAFYAPYTFVRLRLADALPEPEISVSVRSVNAGS